MDKERIEQRIAELQALYAKHSQLRSDAEARLRQETANLQGIQGAIQDCHYWLKSLPGEKE